MSLATYTETANGHIEEHDMLQRTLRDYTLHYTTSHPDYEPPHGVKTESTTGVPNPDYWPTEYRRVPPYRPINRHLDLSERPNGSNRAELLFVTVMMNGVRLQSGLIKTWEYTGARWYPKLLQYKIGGEW